MGSFGTSFCWLWVEGEGKSSLYWESAVGTERVLCLLAKAQIGSCGGVIALHYYPGIKIIKPSYSLSILCYSCLPPFLPALKLQRAEQNQLDNFLKSLVCSINSYSYKTQLIEFLENEHFLSLS